MIFREFKKESDFRKLTFCEEVRIKGGELKGMCNNHAPLRGINRHTAKPCTLT